MHELLTQFGIDWKLLIAQVVNFLILLTLLRLFAYKPIITILRERQKKIADGVAAAEESQRKLIETKETETAILLKAEQDSLAIIDEAQKDAADEESRLLDAAHKKAEQVIASGRVSLEQERLTLVELLEKENRELIATALGRVLIKMDPEERDKALIDNALSELKQRLTS